MIRLPSKYAYKLKIDNFISFSDYLMFFDIELKNLIEIILNTITFRVLKSCTFTKLYPEEIYT
jgi:hypothetical protein